VSTNGADRARADGDPPPAHPRSGKLVTVSVAVIAAALCAMAAAITVSGSSSEYSWLEAIARAAMVGAPIGVGLYAWRRRPFQRFGTLLLATGFVAFLTTLSEASSPGVYAVGRLAAWVIEPLLLYLILAFPSGRLRNRVDRGLVAGVVLALATLWLPTVPLVERFPEPVPWTLCHGGCPDNPLMVTGSEPAVIEDLVRPLREILVILLFAAATLRVAQRLRAASPLMRRTLTPVLGAAGIRLVSFAGLLTVRRVAPDSEVITVWMWSLALCVPLMAGAFLVGLARWRLFIAAGMGRLATRLGGHPRPEDLRLALAEAFDDPTLEIVYPRDRSAGWVTAGGAAVRPPPAGSGRCLTEIRDRGQRIAGIVHDEALRGERAFIDAATAYAVMTLDNDRLGTEAAALLAEVQDSRARIQSTADDERRRIERDLHDGAQQRLVALRIKLELAAERLDDSNHGSAELIRQLGTDVDGALDELRSLARGIYPSPLADRGLVEGLRSAALQAALPTSVLATGVRDRYPREIESAAYFCCLEAVQNAAKHAVGASAVLIDVTDNGVLRFEVRDDGAGFDSATATPGMGLTSMRDRLAAAGGELAIVSSPGKGTRVIGRIPLEPRRESGTGAVTSPGSSLSAPRTPRP
jgi:signal transduction histidine kinase